MKRMSHENYRGEIVGRWFSIESTNSDTVLKEASLEYGRDFRRLV